MPHPDHPAGGGGVSAERVSLVKQAAPAAAVVGSATAGAGVAAPSPYPPPKPLFGDRWPGPAGPIPADLLGCVVAFGVVLATAVPEGPTGVGWLFTASVATAMTIMVAWGRRSRRPLTPDGRSSPWRSPPSAPCARRTGWRRCA